jgi:DNA-binding NtrC family response regulator
VPEHLPPSLLAAVRVDKPKTRAPVAFAVEGQHHPHGLQSEIKALERTRILEAIERCAENQSEAARQLGIPRRTLVARLTELGLTRRRGRDDDA